MRPFELIYYDKNYNFYRKNIDLFSGVNYHNL